MSSASAAMLPAGRRQSAVYHMCFTWNLWDKGPTPPSEADFTARAPALASWLRSLHTNYIFQLERGTENKRLHYQGYIHFPKGSKMRPSQVGSAAEPLFHGFHVRPASTAGIVASKTYSMKSDTRVLGPWSDKDHRALSHDELEELGLNIKLRPFQEQICSALETKSVDDRSVNVLYDQDGSMGKSKIARWLHAHGLAVHLAGHHKTGDLLTAAFEHPAKAYIFDLFRTKAADVHSHDLWAAIEGIRMGSFLAPKWHSTPVCRPNSHVWVFANVLPPLKCLSYNRWHVWAKGPGETIVLLTHQQLHRLTFHQEVADEADAARLLKRRRLVLAEAARIVAAEPDPVAEP